jgi:hemoglobin-like flavoprotein
MSSKTISGTPDGVPNEGRTVSSVTDASNPSLLSPASLGVVRATAPVVAEHADQITAHFYPRMFAAHPELLRVFNQGNQATGEQSKALAGSVVAYAVHLIDPEAPSFDHVLRRIAYKHVSLGIRPEQYTIVGEHFLASVGGVLGDAVTPEVAAAWGEVYWLFALQLVAEEARLYQQAKVDPDQPTRQYRVVRRIEETADVITLVLEPTDDAPLPAVAAGQYVSVFVDLPNGDRQPRQYTVSSRAVQTRLQITIRRVRGVGGAPDGRVSNYLHDDVQIGDVFDVSPSGRLRADAHRVADPAGQCGRGHHDGAAHRRTDRTDPARADCHRRPRRPPGKITPCEKPSCISDERSTTSLPMRGTNPSMTATLARARVLWT